MPVTAFPPAEFFLPGTGEPVLRWGVIAPGGIAGWFTAAVRRHTRQRFVAVASRSVERAEAFAAQHGIERSYGSYEQLVADPEVDVVYIAAPHSEHLALGLLAIAAGKHTLIEKPIATNAADARLLVEAAAQAGVLLMEAMWSRYQPQSAVIRALLAEGTLGEIRSVHADHGQAIPVDHDNRLYRKDLGGGALLDLGVYPIQFDSMVLGTPTSITAVGGMTETGVDAFATLTLGHGAGVQSTVTTSMLTRTPTTAVISGSEAQVALAGPFHVPTTLTISDNQFLGTTQTWNDPTGVSLMDGLSWQATALARFVGEGRTESPVHTLAETVSILETIDEALRQVAADA